MVRAANPALTFIKPCLAQYASSPPSGEQWVHEIKFEDKVSAGKTALRAALTENRVWFMALGSFSSSSASPPSPFRS
jgi:hypothetical protein